MSFLFNIFGGSQTTNAESTEDEISSGEDQEINKLEKPLTRKMDSTPSNKLLPNVKRQKKSDGNDSGLLVNRYHEQPNRYAQTPVKHTQRWPTRKHKHEVGVEESYYSNQPVSNLHHSHGDIAAPPRDHTIFPMGNVMQNYNVAWQQATEQQSAVCGSPVRISREPQHIQHVCDPAFSYLNKTYKMELCRPQCHTYQQTKACTDSPINDNIRKSQFYKHQQKTSTSPKVTHKNTAWPRAEQAYDESDDSREFGSSSQSNLEDGEQLELDISCAFCKLGKKSNEKLLGPYSKVGSTKKYYVHKSCIKWCPDLQDFTKFTLYPPPRRFNVLLVKAITRSSGLKCAYCRKKGASVGCIERKCKHSYHLHCAQNDGAAFIMIENYLHHQKIVPFLYGIYCRDCNPLLRHSEPSGPHHPLNVSKMLRENRFSSAEVTELARVFYIADKVINTREAKKKKEVEVKFFGGDYSQWVQEEDVPESLLALHEFKLHNNLTSEGDDVAKYGITADEYEEEQELEDSNEVVCDICKAEKSTKKNPIIFCDGKGCEVTVHKRCYSVSVVPKGKWMCYRCAAQAPLNLKCSKCNCAKASQAMTCKYGEWVHVTCLNNSKKNQVTKGYRRMPQMARITPRDRQDIWEIILREEIYAKCPVCRINYIKKEGSFQCAHIDATAKGCGRTAQEEIWNMVPSCAKCNLTCNTKNLLDFMDDSIMMRPHIKPLLFLKIKSIIRSQMDCCPLSIKEILNEKNFITVVSKLYNPKKMTTIARLLELSSDEHHNMFVEPDEPAPLHFYKKFLK